MRDDKELWFSLQEYQERLGKVQAGMAEKDVDVLLSHTPENIYYLTGYQSPGYYAYQCCIVPADSDPVMFTRYLESSNVRGRSWVDRCATFQDTEDPVKVTVETLQELGLAKKRIGLELDSWFLTTRNYLRLQSMLTEAELADASGTVEKARLIKSPQEIEYIRQGALAAGEGIRRAVEVIAEGVTENEVAIAVQAGTISKGSEYPGLPPFVTAGPLSALAHATWSGYRIKKGDVVFLEIPGCIHRYHGAQERTVSVGEPSDEVRARADAALASLNAAMEAIKPGVTSDQVDKACRGAMAEAGFGQYYPHRTGYSIGIAFPPDWGEGHIMDLKDGDPSVLQEGMTFHIPPATFMEGNPAGGVGISETVLVTKDGCEVLGDFPRDLLVK